MSCKQQDHSQHNHTQTLCRNFALSRLQYIYSRLRVPMLAYADITSRQQEGGRTLIYAWFPTNGEPKLATRTSAVGYVVAAQVPHNVASAAPKEWPVQTTCSMI
jgi:hypothetical protein